MARDVYYGHMTHAARTFWAVAVVCLAAAPAGASNVKVAFGPGVQGTQAGSAGGVNTGQGLPVAGSVSKPNFNAVLNNGIGIGSINSSRYRLNLDQPADATAAAADSSVDLGRTIPTNVGVNTIFADQTKSLSTGKFQMPSTVGSRGYDPQGKRGGEQTRVQSLDGFVKDITPSNATGKVGSIIGTMEQKARMDGKFYGSDTGGDAFGSLRSPSAVVGSESVSGEIGGAVQRAESSPADNAGTASFYEEAITRVDSGIRSGALTAEEGAAMKTKLIHGAVDKAAAGLPKMVDSLFRSAAQDDFVRSVDASEKTPEAMLRGRRAGALTAYDRIVGIDGIGDVARALAQVRSEREAGGGKPVEAPTARFVKVNDAKARLKALVSVPASYKSSPVRELDVKAFLAGLILPVLREVDASSPLELPEEGADAMHRSVRIGAESDSMFSRFLLAAREFTSLAANLWTRIKAFFASLFGAAAFGITLEDALLARRMVPVSVPSSARPHQEVSYAFAAKP